MSEAEAFTREDAFNLIQTLGYVQMALADESTEPEELGDAINGTLKAIKKAQDKLGIMSRPVQTDMNPFHAIGGAIVAISQPETFAIEATLSRVSSALKEAQKNIGKHGEEKTLADVEEPPKKDEAAKTTSEIMKGMPFRTAKGGECCDMIHVMKKAGFSESQIRAGVFTFWTGADLPSPTINELNPKS